MASYKIIALVICSAAMFSMSHETFVKQRLCGNVHVQLNSIVDLQRTTTVGCPSHVAKAFNELVKLVSEYNVCTMQKAIDITHYYETYLKRPDGEADGPDRRSLLDRVARKLLCADAIDKPSILNEQLVRFAISYGMLVSSACKTLLIEDFYKKASYLLDASDYEALKEWTGDDGPIAQLLAPITNGVEFPLPTDFAALIPEFEQQNMLALHATNSAKIIRAQQVCEKRFRPLYAPIVLPIAHLARNGLDYNRFHLVHHLILLQRLRKHNALWSRIVFLCETLKDIEVIDAPAGSPAGLIEIADKEEVRDKNKPVASTSLKRLRPYQPYADIKGMILMSADIRLKSAVKAFDANRSETDRLREKLLDSRWSLLIASFKSNESTIAFVERAIMMAVHQVSHHEQDKDLELAEKGLLKLLHSDKKSRFFKVITKMASRGKRVVRKLARAIEFILIAFVIMLALFASIK